jgi:hypothetical protein
VTARALRAAARLAAAVCLVAAEAAATEVAVVYVESNVGSASGGHAALRIDDRVYNYQFAAGELLLLEREPWADELFRYSSLDNRPVHQSVLALSEPDARRVRDHFDRAWLAQQRELDAAAAREGGVELLEALAGVRPGIQGRGAGLLDPARGDDPAALALRARIDAELGADFLAREIERIEGALDELSVLAEDGSPRADALLRGRELALERAALVALRDAQGLDPAALLPDDGGALSLAEIDALARFGERLEQAVLALLRSRRPDRGFPLLLASARRLAVARSLAAGRLVLLDPLPAAAPRFSDQEVSRRRAEVAAVGDATARLLDDARRELLAAGALDELAYQRLEELAGRRSALLGALERGAGLPVVQGRLLPARSRLLPAPLAAAPRETLVAALATERGALERQRGALRRRYGYAIVTENCVTAVARGLEQALGGPEGERAALGGALAAGEQLGFVPFVFYAQAKELLRIRSEERIPSHRERVLAERYRSGSRAATYLREANTVSSTIYTPRPADGSFLLFTSDVFWARPLYGAINLAWALGDGSLGLLAAPFDRGRRVVGAGKGVLFSLPELAFINVRKGSFDAATLRD